MHAQSTPTALSPVLRAGDRLLTLIRQSTYALSAASLALIVLAYSYEVMARYLFAAPTGWSAELVSYLLCVMVFTMLPTVTARRGHVAVTVLLERIRGPWRARTERIICVLGFLACLAMSIFAGQESVRQFMRGVAMMATYPIPKWWISVWLVIGFGLAALEFLRLSLTAYQPSASASDHKASA